MHRVSQKQLSTPGTTAGDNSQVAGLAMLSADQLDHQPLPGGGFDTGAWNVWSSVHHPIPSPYINDMAFGADGVIWIASDGGLTRFDPAAPTEEQMWFTYTPANSPLILPTSGRQRNRTTQEFSRLKVVAQLGMVFSSGEHLRRRARHNLRGAFRWLALRLFAGTSLGLVGSCSTCCHGSAANYGNDCRWRRGSARTLVPHYFRVQWSRNASGV
jgi:hypothetical protein